MQKITEEKTRKELEELAAKMRPLIKKIEDDPVRLARAKRAADVLRRTKYFPPPFTRPKEFYY